MRVQRFQASIRDPKIIISTEFLNSKGITDRFIFFALPLITFSLLILFGDKFYFKAVMLFLFLGIILVFAALFLPTRGAKAGSVRLTSTAPLRFTTPNIIWPLIIGMSAVSISGFLAVFEQPLTGSHTVSTGGGFGRFSDTSVFILGLSGTALFLFNARKPSGLTVDDQGVRGEGPLTSTVHIPWNKMRSLDLDSDKHTKVIRLHHVDGSTDTLRPMLLGSDPVIIAETINYFLKHPEQRHMLDEDPIGAISLVADIKP